MPVVRCVAKAIFLDGDLCEPSLDVSLVPSPTWDDASFTRNPSRKEATVSIFIMRQDSPILIPFSVTSSSMRNSYDRPEELQGSIS